MQAILYAGYILRHQPGRYITQKEVRYNCFIDRKLLTLPDTELPGWALALNMPQRQLQPIVPQPRTHWRKLAKLEHMINPGLTEREFRNLFMSCAACGLIMVDVVFSHHRCSEEVVTDSEEDIE